MSCGCRCCLISVERNLKIEANLVVSECIVRYRVVSDSFIKFHVIIFLRFISGVFQHPEHPAGYGNAVAGAVVARRRRFSEVQMFSQRRCTAVASTVCCCCCCCCCYNARPVPVTAAALSGTASPPLAIDYSQLIHRSVCESNVTPSC